MVTAKRNLGRTCQPGVRPRVQPRGSM